MPTQEEKRALQRQLDEERAAAAAAATAEVEPSDEPEDEPGDEEPEVEQLEQPEADEEPEAKSDEQRVKELDVLMAGFEAGLRDVFGIEGELQQVPMDGAIGYMLPGALDLKEHEKYRRCSTCNGHGQVLTGSLADGKQTADCPRCAGRGYLERMEDVQQSTGEANGNGTGEGDPDAGFGVPAWMGDPSLGQPS